jgi:hypothetical protein
MNAHQRRIEKRRKVRMWGKEAAEYQMHMLALGRRVCELMQCTDWEPKTIGAHFDPLNPETFSVHFFSDAIDWKPMPLTAAVIIDSPEFFITKKEPHE